MLAVSRKWACRRRSAYQRNCTKGEHTNAPVYTKRMQHLSYEQWKSSRECTPQERIRRDGRSSISLESVDEIVDRGLEDGEEASATNHDANHRCDPVNFGIRRPSYRQKGKRVSVCLRQGRVTPMGLVPKMKRPPAKQILPNIIGGSLASGTGLPLFALSFLT